MTDRPVILLAAHGERGGAANNARLAQIVSDVASAIAEADVGSVLVNVDGVVERAVEACGTRRLLVLPLLFSDGFFYERRLKPVVTGAGRELAPPLALWASFAPFLADNLALVNGLATFQGLGVPLLFAGSRKRLIGALSNEAPAPDRLGGSVALAFRAAQLGAQMVRVHDVRESVQALHLWRGLDDAGLSAV